MEHFTPSEAPIHETQRLPAIPPRQLVGRDRDLGQAYAQIRAGMPVLLHGQSGIGKTTLAAMIATAYTTFKGGVLWWAVGDDSLAQLLVRVGRAYQNRALTEAVDPKAHLGLAAELLRREHKPLIVLEDMQDLDVAREFIRRVASSVPLIITASERASGPWIPFEVEPLARADAQALFLQAAGLDSAPSETGPICNRLGGIPLDLMLAGRHLAVSGEPPGALLAALEEAEGAVSPGLVAVFQQLPDALKGVVLTLGATFSGSATTALLEVLQLSPTETVMRVMEMLAARGLAQSRPCHDGADCHYLHTRVQALARDWLREAGRWEAAQARVHEAVLAYVEQHHAESRMARTALVAEMPNILGLARHAASQRDADTLGRLIEVLEAVFAASGAYGYELSLLQAAVEREQQEPVPAPFAAASQEGEEPDDLALPAEEDLEAVLSGAGPQDLEAVLDDFVEDGLEADEAVEDLMDAVFPEDEFEGYSEPGSTFESGAVLEEEEDGSSVSGMEYDPGAELITGDDRWVLDDEAVDQAGVSPTMTPAEEALSVEEPLPTVGVSVALDDLLRASREARESGDRGRLATALMMLARAWAERGQYQQAQAAYAEALTLREDSGQKAGLLEVLEALAGISLEMGDLDNAVVYATRAQNLAAQGGDPVRLGHVLALLGDVRLELGELHEAVETYVDAIEALQAGDDEVSLGVVQAKLGATHMDRGEYTRAITMLSSAQVIFADAGLTEYEGRVLGNLGAAYGHLGQWEEAETHHREALAIAQLLDDAEEQERQLANLGYAAQAQEDWDSMQDYYRAALDLAFQLNHREWQLRYLDALGRLLMDNVSQVELAVMLLEEAQRLNPDPERLRLLNRASKRLLRLDQSGIVQEAVPPSAEEWAAGHSV